MTEKVWFAFVETGESLTDTRGERDIIEMTEGFNPSADFNTKQFDTDRAIAAWHRANGTTTHANVVFIPVADLILHLR